MKKHKSKNAQEEMVGFALIVILVAVILLIFISFSIRKDAKEPVESYEVESFLQVLLQYTTSCRDNLEFVSVQKLIIKCQNKEKCLDGKSSCEVLKETLELAIDEGWKTGEEQTTKGYAMNITQNGKEIISLKNGNLTRNYKGAIQPIGRESIDILFTSYY